MDNSAIAQTAELDVSEFFLPSHRVIFSMILELAAALEPVDLVTLAQRLADSGQLEQIGGPSYVSSLTDGMPRVSNISHYVKTVQEKARRRRMMQAGQRLFETAQSGETIEDAERAAIQSLPASGNGTHKAALKESKVLLIPDGAWCDLARVYLEAVGRTTSASPNYHFAVFLAIAGAVVGRSVQYNDGELYPNFFMGLVGESSYSKKGTAMRFGRRMLKDVGTNVLWLMSVDSASGFVKKLSDYQAETKVRDVLCLLHFPELRSLIDKANREGSRDIIPKISEAYDGEDLERNVVGGSGKATNTFTAMIGGAAPDWLENLSEGDLRGGIGNRFCWIPGEAKEPLHKRPAVDRTKWNVVVKSLHEMRVFWAGERDEKLASEMSLSEDADARMEEYGKELYHKTSNEMLIRELCGRMEVHCIKTAMVYAGIERVDVISRSHVDRAILFCNFLLAGLYDIFSHYGLSETLKQEQLIMEHIRGAGEGGIRKRALQQKLWRMDAETLNRRLRWLTGDEGQIREEKMGRSTYLFLNNS